MIVEYSLGGWAILGRNGFSMIYIDDHLESKFDHFDKVTNINKITIFIDKFNYLYTNKNSKILNNKIIKYVKKTNKNIHDTMYKKYNDKYSYIYEYLILWIYHWI